jgi:hypothetical protein
VLAITYHYAIRQVKKYEDLIVLEKIATALIDDPSRNSWAEIRKTRIVHRLLTAARSNLQSPNYLRLIIVDYIPALP